MSRPWTNLELKLLGTKSDSEVARELNRPFSSVWAKRQQLKIPQKFLRRRTWSKKEDIVLQAHSDAEAAKLLGRSVGAVSSRRQNLTRRPGFRHPVFAAPELKVRIPRYNSKEEEELCQIIGGPYHPPQIGRGEMLTCKIHGKLLVGGYSNALIPWPVAMGKPKQIIVCGDLVEALKIESVASISYHFGISRARVSAWRSALEIPRYTPGSWRLLRRNVDLSRTPEARAKMSRAREGKPSPMPPKDRARLRAIQRRPKPMPWRRRMSEKWKKRMALLGPPAPWTEDELSLIGTMPDREVARRTGRTLLAVKNKKFLKRETDTSGMEKNAAPSSLAPAERVEQPLHAQQTTGTMPELTIIGEEESITTQSVAEAQRKLDRVAGGTTVIGKNLLENCYVHSVEEILDHSPGGFGQKPRKENLRLPGPAGSFIDPCRVNTGERNAFISGR